MKHVVKSTEVAHLWAHKAQSDARASHFYFEGDTIFSYGGHFPIARHVKTKAGKLAILFTTRTYSTTTSQHCSMVRGAIPPGVLVIECTNPLTTKPGQIMRDYKEHAEMLEASARRARAGALRLWLDLRAEVLAANEAAEYFSLKARLSLPADYKAQYDKAETYQIEHRAKVDARRAEQRRLNALAFTERLPLWLAGNRQVCLPYTADGSSYLRLAANGGEVETSRGALVPLDHVKAALPLVLRLLAEGKTYAANGHTIHIGHYKLDSIEIDGTVVAGCHRFSRSEVERFAATLT